MMVVTNERMTIMTVGMGPSERPKQAVSAASAVRSAKKPASDFPRTSDAQRALSPTGVPYEPEVEDPCSLSAGLPFVVSLRPWRIPMSWGNTSFSTTAMPAPIMRPMPRLLTIFCATSTDHAPAAVAPAMRPRFATTPPPSQNNMGTKPTR